MRRPILYALRWSFCHVRHDESVLRPKFCGARELDCFKRSSFRRRVGSRIQAGFKRVSFRPPCVVLSGNGQNSGRSIQTQTSCSVRSLSEQRPLRPFYPIPILPFAPATLLPRYNATELFGKQWVQRWMKATSCNPCSTATRQTGFRV